MYELATSQAFILALGALGLGMLMLIKGGDWTVDAAVYIARHFGVSPLVVGFTIIAFGTSLPELLVSTNANFKDLPGISIGNVVGSNIANILLVLGVTAAIATIPAKPRDLARDLAVMFGSTLYFIYLVNSGEVSRLSGFIMVGLLAIYVGWQYWMAKRGKVEIDDIDEPAFKSMPLGILFLLIGLVFIAGGAELLVRGAEVSAGIIGVPDAVIALTLIALGTSLPELSTCVIAALKKHSDIVLGNIIGSNVFNILMIIGTTSALKRIEETTQNAALTEINNIILIITAFLLSILLLFVRKIPRPVGFLFVAAYIAYIVAVYAMFMSGVTLPVGE
ncbi:MAG: sodium transporter [Alphaproteobacteria bacterium]|nr:sodium transporter [Alphaproteobacteria bacterium]|tara:strand:- start:354 stop:1358 length:1005 start_codon:yes stop_codon:yes gene_type:complete